MTDAREARYQAFLDCTTQAERDWIAFLEFEEAANTAADRAALVNPFDDPTNNVRETQGLEVSIGQMLFRAVGRIGLGPLLADAERIGIAVRFGLLEAKPDGLDGCPDADALEAILERGDARSKRT